MLAEAIALSLRDQPQGSPGPSASGGANASQGSPGPSTSAGTKRRAATDPVTAWCVTNRFAELEPALRRRAAELAGGVYWPNDRTMCPLSFSQELAAALQARGANFVRQGMYSYSSTAVE